MKNNSKKVFKKVVFVLILIFNMCFTLFLSLISPYETWDPTVIDIDVLDALKALYLISLFLNALCIWFTKSQKIFLIAFSVLFLISLGKVISLLLL